MRLRWRRGRISISTGCSIRLRYGISPALETRISSNSEALRIRECGSFAGRIRASFSKSCDHPSILSALKLIATFERLLRTSKSSRGTVGFLPPDSRADEVAWRT